MEFRVYLGYKDGVPIPIADIPKGRAQFGEVLTCAVGARLAMRIVDEKGSDKLSLLYDPIILKMAPVYMEIGGVLEDGVPQSWILRAMPIEATKEWAALQTGGPVLNGSMAHFGKALANPVAGSTKKDSGAD